MPITKYLRGSDWRKWDLHIHTPKSICNNYGGDTPEIWERFISSLESLPDEVKVIGINDYYFIDGFKKVMQFKKDGRLNNIDMIFPIIEFRIDTFGSGNENKLQKINLHILFDIDLERIDSEVDKIEKEFIEQINLTGLDDHRTKVLSKENMISEAGNLQDGFSNLVPSTKQVFEVINSKTWKNRTFLFLGYKEWSNLDKNKQIKDVKKDLFDRVDAYFSANGSTISKSQEWVKEFGNKRVLHSGDIHDFEYLDTFSFNQTGEKIESVNYSCNTWIKGDPTFEGLKSISFELEDRVKIQESKPEQKAGYQVIDSISISHADFCCQEILLSENLNSIIGGRSTGKSILLGGIAKKLNTTKLIKTGNDEYIAYVKEVAEKIRIVWKDGVENNNRDIEYFPQSYMNELAKDEAKLSTLIQNILKQSKEKESHLTNYETFCSDNNRKILDETNKLFRLSTEVSNKRHKIREKGDKQGIEREIAKLSNDLSQLNNRIPCQMMN